MRGYELSTRLTLVIIGLTAVSGLVIPPVIATTLAEPNTVNSAAIIDGQVKKADIASNAVTYSKIQSGAVDGSKIQDGGIGLADLASNSVNSNKIVDQSIQSNDIGTNAVTGDKIADETIEYIDVSEAFIVVDRKDDCDCGGTGWDPDNTSNFEIIFDNRITTNSVVSITFTPSSNLCATTAAGSGSVTVICNDNISQGTSVNFAIFNPQ